jgi:hypothetical protein
MAYEKFSRRKQVISEYVHSYLYAVGWCEQAKWISDSRPGRLCWWWSCLLPGERKWWLSSSKVDARFGLLLLSQRTFLDYFRQSAARLVRVPGWERSNVHAVMRLWVQWTPVEWGVSCGLGCGTHFFNLKALPYHTRRRGMPLCRSLHSCNT